MNKGPEACLDTVEIFRRMGKSVIGVGKDITNRLGHSHSEVHPLSDPPLPTGPLERPGQAYTVEDVVVRFAEVKTIQEPQPLLGKREGQRPAARGWPQGWYRQAAPFLQRHPHMLRQASYSRRLEEVLKRDLDLKNPVDACQNLRR